MQVLRPVFLGIPPNAGHPYTRTFPPGLTTPAIAEHTANWVCFQKGIYKHPDKMHC